MDARVGTETLIGRNRALLRRAAGAWVYSELLFDEAAEAVLMAHVAQLRARHLLLRGPMQRHDGGRPMQRHDGGPNAP
jgi:hypothetical protein